MDLLKLFTREEPVAGLEIGDDFIRVALLSVDKKDSSIIKAEAVGEAALPEGIVFGGQVNDGAALARALGGLLKGLKKTISYATVSVSSADVYNKIFIFPKSVSGERLEESMKLTVGFSLPMSADEVYLDWEKTGDDSQSEIFLAEARKTNIDGYLAALHAADLKAVAVEFYPMSLSRVVDCRAGETILIVKPEKSGTGFAIVKDRSVRFGRFVPYNREKPEDLAEEARKIVDFYESNAPNFQREPERGEVVSGAAIIGDGKEIEEAARRISERLSFPAEKARLIPRLAQMPDFQDGSRWLVVAGAAFRGLLPRSDDTLISLMPIGTEEAYEYHRAAAFSEFVSNVVVGVSALIAAAFLGVWLMMTSIQSGLTERIGRLEAVPLPQSDLELRERAEKLNALTGPLAVLSARSPKWSIFLKELRKTALPGISITNIAVSSPTESIGVSGVAANRGELNAFKKTLENSGFFSDIAMPLTNLEQREKISFSVSFRLKDQNSIYDIQ
ncbi:MAG: pilus assembly protein PilM [Parcubacteria group bacterium]|nr:pilus assembly protein PilM [Parcubacteria group bacterium]